MKFTKVIMICLLFLTVFIGKGITDDGPAVLLINSDATVEKYKVTEDEFKKTLSHPVVEVRLDEKRWGIAEVEDLLYDTPPELIYCIGTKAFLIANEFAGNTNIVFSSIINWQRLPIMKSAYGVSNELHPGMQMMLFRHIFPKVNKIGLLYSKKYNSQWFENASKAANAMGIEIVGQPISYKKNSVSTLKGMLPGIDALWLISDPVLVCDNKSLMAVLKACEKNKTPVFSYHEAFAKYGVTLVVSVDDPTIGRQAAGVALEVLSGEKIQERVQNPAGSHIILNLNKVKKYGLEYNEDALASVNKIID